MKFIYIIKLLFEKSQSQLKTGTRVEKEHKSTLKSLKKAIKPHKIKISDKTFFKKIAQDHLSEFPTYYTELGKMEAKLKSKKK